MKQVDNRLIHRLIDNNDDRQVIVAWNNKLILQLEKINVKNLGKGGVILF